MDRWMDGLMRWMDDIVTDEMDDGWMILLLYLSAPRWDYCSRYFSVQRPPEVPSTVHS